MSEILLSQLAYAELISPKPDETVKWMIDVLGLEETTREGQSVYMRGWAEWLHSSLIVTEGPQPALGRVGFRTYGPGDPDAISRRVEGKWLAERPGRGAAFQYKLPVGRHLIEVFWEAERYVAPPEKAEEDFQFRPQKFPGRGAQTRYIDHVTIASPDMQADIDLLRQLGHRQTATISPEPGFTVFSTTTCNAIRSSHDFAFVPDFGGSTGRFNHIAYHVDQRLDVERAAEVFMANGTPLEFGPGIHGIDEITYVYVREPGGARIEINSGGWQNYLPDWESVDWNPAQGATTMWKNLPMPDSMMESFPAVSGREQAELVEAGQRSSGLFGERD